MSAVVSIARAALGPDAAAWALAARLAGDLDGSFEELVRTHQDVLYSFAVALARDPGRAEDVVQDSLVRAYRALGRYPPERVRAMAIRPWLLKIVLNTFRNSVRRGRLEAVLMAEPPPVADHREGPEDAAVRAEDRATLLAALAGLPLTQRAAVLLRYSNDLGYSEMAAVLAQPVGTVKSNVHRGVLALRSSVGAAPAGKEGRSG